VITKLKDDERSFDCEEKGESARWKKMKMT
jgi:hypothetical protein